MSLPTDLVRQIKYLDPMPVTAQRLMRALQDEQVGAMQVAQYVEYDPAMASVVLRLANSAAYAGGRPTVDLCDAVVRLGTAKILALVLGGALHRLKAKVPMYGLGEDELWLHSVTASLAVRALQAERPLARIPDAAPIAALLHDIGKLVMGRYLKADARRILATCDAGDLTFVEAERELLGCDHTEVGAALGRRWGLPEAVTLAIERHHQDPLVEPTPTIDAVVVANVVAKSVGAGLGAEGMHLKVDDGSLSRLGIKFGNYSRVLLQTVTWVDEVKASYRVAAA